MAEHDMPVIMQDKKLQLHIQQPGQPHKTQSVIGDNKPKVSDPKKSLAQKLSKYSFGEELEDPAGYVWKSYLEPTGKRVANDIVEYFLTLIKHTFQRFLWDGKILDRDNVTDRYSYSDISRQNQPIMSAVKMSPVKEISFNTQEFAQRVLNELKNQDGNYATVRSYYEASNCPEQCDGVSSSSGWSKESLAKVEVKPSPDGDGFYLNLPRPVGLKARG